MGLWRDLFLEGEYMPRGLLLSGLTMADVTQRPGGASRTIYEELWHATKWQTIVVEDDRAARDAWVHGGEADSFRAPGSESDYIDLVKEFITGAEKAAALGEASGQATNEPMQQELLALAVHNAYHLGKIAALRQVIGAWPPG